MKRIQILGFALFAVFAFSAVMVSAAFAAEPTGNEPALWLTTGGVEINKEELSEAEGELELRDTKVPIIGAAAVLCSGILDGRVGPGGTDIITELLTLAGVKVPELAEGGTALLCTALEGCEASTTDIELRPDFLPWLTTVLLMTLNSNLEPVELFLDLISEETIAKLGEPGYDLVCLVLGAAVEDLCSGPSSLDLELMPTGELLGTFELEELELEGLLANCTQGGNQSGHIDGSGVIRLASGAELDVSSN